MQDPRALTKLAANPWPQSLDRIHSPGAANGGARAARGREHIATPFEHQHALAGIAQGCFNDLRERTSLGTLPKGIASDTAFVSLQNAYRPSGGLATGEELAARLHVNGEGGYARLARWIVGRQVFSFSWHEHFWLPMFQFEGPELALREGLRPVLSELVDVMDGWSLAAWFAQPSAALEGHSPLSVGSNRLNEVLHAARLQRRALRA